MKWKNVFSVAAVAALAAMLSAPAADAATIKVPDDYTTLSMALDAATSIDTVLITDSGTYELLYVIGASNGPITLLAEAGQNPTIKCPAGTSNKYILDFNSNSCLGQGSQIGSNSGGHINFDCNGSAADPYGPFDFDCDDEESLLIENCSFYGASDSGWYVTKMNGAYGGNLTMRDCDMNAEGVASNVIYHSTNAWGRYTFERCTFRGGNRAQLAGYHNYEAHPTTWTLINCELGDVTGGDWITDTNKALRIYGSGAGQGLFIIRADGCVFRSHSPGPYGAINNGRSYHADIEIKNSVIISTTQNAVRIGDGSTSLILTIDHCDLFSSDSAIMLEDGGPSNRVITVTNSNLIATNGPGTTGTLTSGDSVTLAKNNIYSGIGVDHGGDFSGNTAAFTEDPGYTGYTILGDVQYSNSNLYNQATDGGDIGNNSSYIGLVPVELSTFMIQ
jgi:hypothetical protein